MGLIAEKNLVFTHYKWRGKITKRCESTSHSTLARYITRYNYWEMEVLEEVLLALEEGIAGRLSPAEKISIGLEICDIWITSEHVEVYAEGLPYESKEIWSHESLQELLLAWKAFLQSPPYEGEEVEVPSNLYVSKKTWRYIALAIFLYFLFRSEMRYSPERFDFYPLRFITTFFYFLPVLGFGISTQLLLLPAGYTWRSPKRILIDAAIAASFAFFITCQVYSFYYSTLLSDLFGEWNTGALGRASDFRMETYIAFLLNFIVFVYCIRKSKQSPA